MADSNNSVVSHNENTPKSSRSGQSFETKERKKTENVLRPILLEDYSYEESPESLQCLLKYFESSNDAPTRIDILVGLIYVLMLESGFVPIDYEGSNSSCDFNYQRVITLSQTIPLAVKNTEKTYCIKMSLPEIQQFEVKLVIIGFSDELIVNCFVEGMCLGCVLLNPLTYFISSRTNLTTLKFQHLDILSRNIKFNFAYPVKCWILNQNGIAFPCLEYLPNEVILMIMKKLPLLDLIHLGNTNRRFCLLMNDLKKKCGKKTQ